MVIGLKFSPEIQAGHILQAVFFVFTVTSTVVWAYNKLDEKSNILERRLSVLEAQIVLRNQYDEQWRREVRDNIISTQGAIARIEQNISGVRQSINELNRKGQ